MTDWRALEATNQTVFRDMNEWAADERDGRSEPNGEKETYLCECGDGRCSDPIALTRAEYEHIRGVPTRFAIKPNHENPEVDAVVAENERFATVEKAWGEAGRIARSRDPRR